MTSFTTRVLLHGADADDYESLHSCMEDEGFTRIISSDDADYCLPEAEYNIVGEFPRSQVLDKAKTAAANTRKKYQILVTQSAGRTWHGLDKAD